MAPEVGTPDAFSCSNCSWPLTTYGGAVNEIHIYSSTNEFEKSITILDALCEIFGLATTTGTAQDHLTLIRETGDTLLMCARCAEIVSLLYKDFLNLIQLSAATGYVSKLLSHLEYWRKKSASAAQVQSSSTNTQLVEENVLEPDSHQGCEDDDDYLPSSAEESDDEDGQNVQPLKTKRKPAKRLTELPRGTALSTVQTKEQGSRANTAGGRPNQHFFKCSRCPKGFLLNWELYEHSLLIHDGKKQSCCESCGFQYYPELLKIDTHKCVRSLRRKDDSGRPVFTCRVCGVEFKIEKLLKHHQQKAHILESIKFECFICHRNCIRRASLLQHYSQHHAEPDARKHQCTECGMRFQEMADMEKHTAEVHVRELEGNSEVCSVCGKGFSSVAYRNSHMRNVHGIRKRKQLDQSSWICDICGKVFHQPKKLRAHKNYKHGKEEAKRFQCNICAKRFWNNAKLQIHTGIHTHGLNANTKAPREVEGYQLKFNCTQCLLSFDYKAHVDLHTMKFHGGEPTRYECDLCKEHFQRNIDFVLHKRTHMTREEKRLKTWKTKSPDGEYNCDQCGKDYTTLRNLFTHTKAVHAATRVKCDLCGKEVGDRQLHIHYKAIHPEKYVEVQKELEEKKARMAATPKEPQLWTCDICMNGKTYSSKYSLQDHKAAHAETTIPCPNCDRRFGSQSSLRRHIRLRHSPDAAERRKRLAVQRKKSEAKLKLLNQSKQFLCTICNNGRNYSSKYSLQEHITYQHEAVPKRVPCPTCEQTFASESSLAKHLRTQHQQDPYGSELNALFASQKSKSLNSVEPKPTVTQTQLSCSVCGHCEATAFKLKMHMKSAHPPKIRQDLEDQSEDPSPGPTGVKVWVKKGKGNDVPAAEKRKPVFIRLRSSSNVNDIEKEKRLVIPLARID